VLADTDITVLCYLGTTNTTQACNAVARGDTVGVTANTTFLPITPGISGIVGSALNLSSSSRRTIQW
jgi:hypothetical protein